MITTIPSDWLINHTWLQRCNVIGWSVTRDKNTKLWLAAEQQSAALLYPIVRVHKLWSTTSYCSIIATDITPLQARQLIDLLLSQVPSCPSIHPFTIYLLLHVSENVKVLYTFLVRTPQKAHFTYLANCAGSLNNSKNKGVSRESWLLDNVVCNCTEVIFICELQRANKGRQFISHREMAVLSQSVPSAITGT